MRNKLRKLNNEKLIDLILEYEDYIDNYYFDELKAKLVGNIPMSIIEYWEEEQEKELRNKELKNKNKER